MDKFIFSLFCMDLLPLSQCIVCMMSLIFYYQEYNKKIAMRWRFKSWPDEHYSTVSIVLTEKDTGTELQLTQTEIPEAEYERTRQGWINNYWEAIRQTFGFGARLYWAACVLSLTQSTWLMLRLCWSVPPVEWIIFRNRILQTMHQNFLKDSLGCRLRSPNL